MPYMQPSIEKWQSTITLGFVAKYKNLQNYSFYKIHTNTNQNWQCVNDIASNLKSLDKAKTGQTDDDDDEKISVIWNDQLCTLSFFVSGTKLCNTALKGCFKIWNTLEI